MIREVSHEHILPLIHGDEGLTARPVVSVHLALSGDGDLAGIKSDDVDMDRLSKNLTLYLYCSRNCQTRSGHRYGRMTVYLEKPASESHRIVKTSIFSQLADCAVTSDWDIRDTVNNYTSHTLHATQG